MLPSSGVELMREDSASRLMTSAVRARRAPFTAPWAMKTLNWFPVPS